MKFRVITADPPWSFGDKLSAMKDSTQRGADAYYSTMDLAAIKALSVKDIAEDDAVLGLWCPSSMLQDGLDVMKAWGFRQVQEWIWVKLTARSTSDEVKVTSGGVVTIATRAVFKALSGAPKAADVQMDDEHSIALALPLVFGMGRLARSCKETFLVGVRGSPYKQLSNRSIRDVFFAPAGRHSEKPECFQDALDEMFPEGNRLEMFARRERAGEPFTRDWVVVGNECPATPGEDIRDSLKRLLEMGS